MKKQYYLELPKDIHLPSDTKLTPKLISKLVELHKTRIERYMILQKYYEGWARILERDDKADYKADNRLVLGYPSYIVDMLLGMFLGKPLAYVNNNEEVEDVWEDIQAILDYNDEQKQNFLLGKSMGIKGRAYEIMYINEDGYIRFNKIEADNILYIWDDKIDSEPLFALYIREGMTIDSLLNGEGDKTLVTAYTRDEVIDYEEGTNGYEEVNRHSHAFGEVPVLEIKNNDEGIGDFERVLSLIDAINLSQSDTANDFEEFTDALLLLYGMLNADHEDVQKFLADGIVSLDEVQGNQGAEWLIKNINDAALENYKTRLDNDIHKFSKVPNMSDKAFGGNQSGVAQKYKLLAMDQVLTQKRRQMKELLQKRIRLILNIKNIQSANGVDLRYKDIDIVFKDNKPIDERENTEMVAKLKGITSDKTALSQLYFIEDVDKEMEAIEQETSAYAALFNKEIEDDTDDE